MRHHRLGGGSPLVLIHGIGSRWQVWRPVLPTLAAHRDVIAVDLPGFGSSPPDGGSGSVPDLASRVASFLASIGVRRPVVGGSSLGGGVALELGRRGVARGVVAFSPVGFYGGAGARWCQGVVSAARAGGAALQPLLATRAGRVALCGVFYGRPGRLSAADCVDDARALVAAPGFAAARRGLGEWRFTSAMAADLAGVPVTVAWGTRDVVLPYRWQAIRARSMLPTARHVRLDGCGHLPFTDSPSRCAALLLDG